MDNNYEIKIYRNWLEVAALEKSWADLIKRSEVNYIFNTFTWCKTWWRNFGAKQELFVLTVSCSDNLVALAPLMIKRKKYFKFFIRKELTFIGTPEADYCDFIIDQKHQSVIYQLIWQKILDYCQSEKVVISFKDVPTKSLLSGSWHQIAYPYKSVYQGDDCYQLNYADFSLTQLDQFINKRDTKQKIKKLNRLGEINMYWIKDSEELDLRLADFFMLFQKRALQKGYLRFFNHHAYQDFFRELCREFLNQGLLRLWVLTINKKTVALDINFLYNNVYARYLPAFDRTYARYSPGLILLEKVISAGKLEANVYDFLRGGETYKENYINIRNKNQTLNLYPNKLTFVFWEKWFNFRIRLKKIKILGLFYHYFKCFFF